LDFWNLELVIYLPARTDDAVEQAGSLEFVICDFKSILYL
jgi:hypothetical protein